LVDIHTHAASAITSGVFDFDRIQQVLEVESDGTEGTPTEVDLTTNIVGGNLHTLVLILGASATTATKVILPTLGAAATGKVTVRVNEFEDPSDDFVQIVLDDDTAIFPASGYTEFDPGEELTFRWNNGRWDMDLRPNPSATTAVSIFKPNASGTLGLSEPSDSTFRIVGSSDATKKVAFEVDGLTTATVRTLTVPDASGTLALTSLVGTPAELVIACSDETSNLTTGTAKVTFRMPYAMTLSSVRASVNTAPTGSTLIVDINEGGSTILSTKLSIDASELTSTTAATAAVISDTALADDAEITIDIDQIGSTIAGKGLKVVLKGTRA
jgi:hypothetical protein